MRRASLAFGLAVASFFAHDPPATAEFCTIDDVPAATLLLPYFEVDLDSAERRSPPCSRSTTPRPRRSWPTSWSGPTCRSRSFDFNIYLTGYDVQTINMRDIFNGTVPRTASVGQDPTRHASARRVTSRRTSTSRAATASCRRRRSRRRSSTHLQAALTGAVLGDPERLRRPRLRRQHRPRLRHGRHGQQLHPALPRRRRLLRLRRHGRRDQPERPLGRLLLRQPGRELRPGRDAGPHRGRRPPTRRPRSPASTPSTAAT